ncbi:MAG: EAL domain-containing protein [Pseudomonadota bacterium]
MQRRPEPSKRADGRKDAEVPVPLIDSNQVRLAVLTGREEQVEALNKCFRNAGIASHCQWCGDLDALTRALGDDPELVVVDRAFAAPKARDLVDWRNRTNPKLPILYLDAALDADRLSAAFRDGASDVVQLTDPARLIAVADRELRLARTEHALDATIDSATQYKKQIKALMAETPDALAYIQEGIVVDVNPAWLELLGYRDETDLIGHPVMDTFKPESRGPLKGAIVATLQGKWNAEALETVALTAAGDEVSLKVHLQATEYDGDPCVKVLCSVDREGPNTRELKLRDDALTKDPATLLYHRAHYVELTRSRLNQKLKSGLRILAWIRPDNFSRVCNDVGHIASETVFAEFADLARSQLLPNDICGRFDGLSVMVLLERGRLQDAENWAQRFVEQVSRHVFTIGDQSTTLTCTVGLCAASEELTGFDQLLLGARSALEQGKDAGGNATVTNETSNSDSRIQSYDAIWARHLKSALVENRFRLLKQPIVALSGEGQGVVDLLIRMIDHRGKPVLPSEFIPAAERNNMMQAIDRWVIAAAADYCKQRAPSMAFIKLSYQSLQDASLLNWLSNHFGQPAGRPNNLCFSISEESAAKYLRETKRLRKILADLGARFALEHVGNARQPAQLIEHLQPDYVKIDGGLIGQIAATESVQTTVRRIVELASNFGAQSIAEQVEDANTMAVLWQIGIQFMQGHYVHEPEVVLQDADSPAPLSISGTGM